jgi:hypothetical protein
MTGSRLTIAGRVLRHAMGVLLLCWMRALKWGGIAALAGILATEIAAVVLTRSFPPDGLAQVVAFTFGGALAFGVAATIIADELVVGIIESVRLLAGEAEAGIRAAAMVARREVGESSGRVLSLFGLGGIAGAAVSAARRSATSGMLPAPLRDDQGPQDEVVPRLQALRARVPSTAAARPAPAQPPTPENPWAATLTPVSEWPAGQAEDAPPAAASEADEAETLADLAGAGAALAMGPPGEPNPATQPLARPVHATNLPRIDWTVEDPPTLPPEPAADEAATRRAGYGAPTPTTQPMTGAPGLAEPPVWHTSETAAAAPDHWHDPTQAAEPEVEEAGITPVDLFGAPPPAAPSPSLAGAFSREPDAGTRPLPEKTRPLEPGEAAERPRGSVWDHISQVLAGRPVPPIPSEVDPALDDPAEGDASGAGR